MFITSLGFTGICGVLLLVLNRIARHERKYAAVFGGLLFWVWHGYPSWPYVFCLLPHPGQHVRSRACAFVCGFRKPLPKPVTILTLILIVAWYGVVGGKTLLALKELERQYPIKSLETRLAYENEHPPSIRLAGAKSQPTSPLVVRWKREFPFVDTAGKCCGNYTRILFRHSSIALGSV